MCKPAIGMFLWQAHFSIWLRKEAIAFHEKNPYITTAGISLLLHAGLLLLVLVFGSVLYRPASGAPIEVEFVPVGVVDTGR